jgi:hypothetical protein
MMHSILVVVTKPSKKDKFPDERWNAFLGELSSSPPSNSNSVEGPERIGETVWLIAGQNGLPVLGNVLDRAHHHGIACKVRFLEGVTEWASTSKAT